MKRATYAASGVDIGAAERTVDLLKGSLAGARRPEVVDDIGGFAGLFRLDIGRYRKPVLATSTDGVGTKLAIATALDKHDTVGLDLVAMVTDDVVVCGAEPLFMTDYIACGRIVPERIAEIVGGIAEGCRRAGCALIGGETAAHPGVLEPDEYDLAGAATGIVEADAVLGPERVRAGDVVIAMGSSGLHSNGYSLVRRVLLDEAGLSLEAPLEESPDRRTLGEELLEPTTIYTKACLELARRVDVHAYAHITQGGIPGNLARALPSGLDAIVDRSTWSTQPIFDLIARTGRVDDSEMERTFNMGVGMAAVVEPAHADRALEILADLTVPAWTAGEVRPGTGSVHLTGRHRSR